MTPNERHHLGLTVHTHTMRAMGKPQNNAESPRTKLPSERRSPAFGGGSAMEAMTKFTGKMTDEESSAMPEGSTSQRVANGHSDIREHSSFGICHFARSKSKSKTEISVLLKPSLVVVQQPHRF